MFMNWSSPPDISLCSAILTLRHSNLQVWCYEKAGVLTSRSLLVKLFLLLRDYLLFQLFPFWATGFDFSQSCSQSGKGRSQWLQKLHSSTAEDSFFIWALIAAPAHVQDCHGDEKFPKCMQDIWFSHLKLQVKGLFHFDQGFLGFSTFISVTLMFLLLFCAILIQVLTLSPTQGLKFVIWCVVICVICALDEWHGVWQCWAYSSVLCQKPYIIWVWNDWCLYYIHLSVKFSQRVQLSVIM